MDKTIGTKLCPYAYSNAFTITLKRPECIQVKH